MRLTPASLLLAHISLAQNGYECSVNSDCTRGQINVCDNGFCRRANNCDGKTCRKNATCERKTGSCPCNRGYFENSRGECKKDQCLEKKGGCHSLADCANIENSKGDFEAKCTCRPGRIGDGIDFCARDFCGAGKGDSLFGDGNHLNRCGANAICKTLGREHKFDYECFCKPGFVGRGARHKNLGGSGYKQDCEAFDCDAKLIDPQMDPKYEIVKPVGDQGYTWTAARQQCQMKGAFWDLAVIDSKEEHQKIMNLANCATNAFWIGVKRQDQNSELETIMKEPANMLGLWRHEDETREKDLCVRMRLGKFHDANCRNAFTLRRTSGVGMGFICERHNKRVQAGLKCETQSDRVDAFKASAGCPMPQCLGKDNFEIIDSWKRPANHGQETKYGFTARIRLSNHAIQKGGSVLLRFPTDNRQGSIQTYNLKFFGFYNNNNDVLLHTKWWNTDRDDKNTVVVTVDNISSVDYPDVFYWPMRVNNHRCFTNGNGRRANVPVLMDNVVKVFRPDKTSEDVISVKFSMNNIIKRVQA